jgi:hypothetical protein
MRRLLILFLLLTLPVAGKKKPMGAMYRKPDQKVEIPNASAALAVAHRKCENFAWGAIVESMMHVQQVNISQDEWSSRTSDGDKCFPALDDYSRRASALSGDYALDGGRKVRIHAEYTEGPASADAMIYSLRIGRPLMLIWNGRPYLLYGIVYDELFHVSGKANAFIVRELHLLDAALPAKDPHRAIVVKKENDDDTQIAGIGGVMSISVDSRNFYDIDTH